MSRLRRNAPAITLFLVAPAVGELLSGSAPPREFFNPFFFALITTLYGSGALLVREAARGWRKGWPSLLCLAAAYGIFEEGIVCKSFFDPAWPDLGRLGVYGRSLGTNWVWVVWLTLYHSFVSILTPILLVEVAFPARRADPWLARRWRIVLVGIMLLEALFGYYALSKFRPAAPHYLLTWLALLGLVVLASRLPAPRTAARGPARPRPFWFWCVGFLWTFASFAVFFALPHTRLPAVLTVGIGLAVAGVAGWLVLRMADGLAGWDDRRRFLLGAGVLSLFIALAPLQQLDKKRPDDTSGMALVGLAALVLLLWQGRRVWVRSRVSPGSACVEPLGQDRAPAQGNPFPP